MAKKKKLPKEYRESPKQRLERVREEGNRFRSRIETPATVYNRKKDKHSARRNHGGDYYD